MRTVFADTGYWIAQFSPDDGLHHKAEEVTRQQAPFLIVTTEMVLGEFLTYVTRRRERHRAAAAAWVKALASNPDVEVVPQTSAQFEAAVDLYAARPDKQWSLVDCASFVLMEQRDIREALAYDHDFTQAGFDALLR